MGWGILIGIIIGAPLGAMAIGLFAGVRILQLEGELRQLRRQNR